MPVVSGQAVTRGGPARKPVLVAAASANSVRGSGEWLAFVWSSVPGLILASVAAAGLIPRSVALSVFAISFVGFNLMHMGATWARVYVRPGWKRYPVERLVVPAGLAGFALSFEAVGGGALLLATQYFLSFHHALMQNYGLLRVSQRRCGRHVDVRLDLAACLLLPGAALLYRAGIVCNTYAGALLPAAPLVLVQAMAAAGACALIAFACREWLAWRAGQDVDPIGLGLVFGTNLMWAGMLIGNTDPAMPLYALASGHYAQYLYFVWRAEQRDPLETSDRWVTRPMQMQLRSSRMRYLIVLLAMGGAVTVLLTFASVGLRAGAAWMQWRPEGALDIPPWAAAMIGVSLEHYWLDHRIWRRPRPAVVGWAAAQA